MEALIPGTLLVASLGYARGLGVLWRRGGMGRGVSMVAAACFYGGIATLVVALMSPLEAMAHQAFSLHMLQHVLLMLVAAPLLVAGAPLLPLLFALPRRWRLRLARAWSRSAAARGAGGVLVSPLSAWILGTLALWAWHLPGLYRLALLDPWLHALEHASLLGTAALFWWLVLRPTGRRRAHGGPALLLVFGMKVQSGALGALIAFAPRPMHPLHGASAGRWNLTPMEDQQLAGLVMGAPTTFVFLAVGAALFLLWLRAIERAGGGEPRRASGVGVR